MGNGNAFWIVVAGVLGAAAGSVGTLLINRLFPGSSPGDGYSVRLTASDGEVTSIDFGEDEKTALQRAIELAAQGGVVEVVETRQGVVQSVQRTGKKERISA